MHPIKKENILFLRLHLNLLLTSLPSELTTHLFSDGEPCPTPHSPPPPYTSISSPTCTHWSPNCFCHVLALIINETSWWFQVTYSPVRAEMSQREERIHFWTSDFSIEVQNQNTVSNINLFLSRDQFVLRGGQNCPSAWKADIATLRASYT